MHPWNASSRALRTLIVGLVVIVICTGTSTAAPPRAWELRLAGLRGQRDDLLDQLERIHAALVIRATSEAPGLLPRLSTSPPRPLQAGYGILPEIRADSAPAPIEPQQTIYSLPWLTERFAETRDRIASLSARTGVERPPGLEPLVVDFEASREELELLEEHLSYHAHWQKAVADQRAFFDERNRLVAMVREMRRLSAEGAAAERVAALGREVVQRVAPFRPTPGLTLRQGKDGKRVLPVAVCTDIVDSRFLDAFQDAVQAAFSLSPPARRHRFSVQLDLRRVRAEDLYPDGPPDRGAGIDVRAHRARFPDCPLVLTTGAESTHAWPGDSILIGPGPLGSRTLAHEFGHLLGFQDAYLRGYDGDPGGPTGAVLVEWTGLTDDLMGSPGTGLVSDDMIATLIAAYTP